MEDILMSNLKLIIAITIIIPILTISISLADTNKDISHNPVDHDKCNHNHDEKCLLDDIELDASIVIDAFYYHDDSDEGFSHSIDELRGFGHSHLDDGHQHSEIDNGFNLRHVELGFSAQLDQHFIAWTTLAIDDDNCEIEEAVIQTSSLPYGITLKAGKLLSGIGLVNSQHSHELDFFDMPLILDALFGSHGLQEKGVQLTYHTEAPCNLHFGIEALNGDNEKMFNSIDSDHLPDKDGPRLFTGFIKSVHNIADNDTIQLGLSFASGHSQEAHASNGLNTNDHWLDGRSELWGADLLYKHTTEQSNGAGDIVVQAEYFYRKSNLEISQHDTIPALESRDKISQQDGYYIQGLYGLSSKWRIGTRWEMIGLLNREKLPDLSTNNYGPSRRFTLMTDWKLSDDSLLRLQIAHFDMELEDKDEKGWQAILQWQIAFGKHEDHHD